MAFTSMPGKRLVIPPGSLILVTGANGYIASNIVDLLLELGYHVRGTVRAAKPWLNELFDEKYGQGRFETVVIPELDKAGALDDALNGTAAVIHVASDVSLSPDPHVVIPAVVAGVENLIQTIAKHTSVKRFILTSSAAAAHIPTPNVKNVITKDTWDDAAVKAAWQLSETAETIPDLRTSFLVYAASKTQGERAAWKWVRENKPRFVLNTVLPGVTYGRILSPHIFGSTMGYTRGLFQNDDLIMRLLPPQWYVDVQDTARLHVVALLDPDVENERIFAYAGPHNWTDIVGILRKMRPNRNLCEPPKDEGRDVCDVVPSTRAEQLLQSFFGRKGWTSLEESLAEGIVDIE